MPFPVPLHSRALRSALTGAAALGALLLMLAVSPATSAGGPMHPAGGQRGRVREHAAGRAAEPVGGRRIGRRLDPGLRDGHERQQGRHDLVQDQLGDVQLPRRHPAARLLRRERRADDAGQPRPDRPHVAAALPDVRHDRADRLRELVRHAYLDGAEHGRVGRLHRAPRAQRHRRRQPDHLRRPRRRRQRRRGRADLRRDVAGVQRLGRQQPLQVHGRRARPASRPRTRPPTRSPTTARCARRGRRRCSPGPSTR